MKGLMTEFEQIFSLSLSLTHTHTLTLSFSLNRSLSTCLSQCHFLKQLLNTNFDHESSEVSLRSLQAWPFLLPMSIPTSYNSSVNNICTKCSEVLLFISYPESITTVLQKKNLILIISSYACTTFFSNNLVFAFHPFFRPDKIKAYCCPRIGISLEEWEVRKGFASYWS